MNLGTIKGESTNIKTIVADFTVLLNARLQQFEQTIKTDKKIGTETMEILRELPMIKLLEKQVQEKNTEIARLKVTIRDLRK